MMSLSKVSDATRQWTGALRERWLDPRLTPLAQALLKVLLFYAATVGGTVALEVMLANHPWAGALLVLL